MTIYYDVRSGVVSSCAQLQYTVFAIIVWRIEFWMFVILHGGLVALVRYRIVDIDNIGIPVESASLVQFFVTFLTTFYNKHCYARFLTLYSRCTDVIDAVLLLVFELSVSLNHPTLKAHRTLATKYILAATYVLFMELTGGEMNSRRWRELMHKGLLTKTEMETLADYPGGKVSFLLANWTMQVVDYALDSDEVYWIPKNQQRIAHLHNRINNHVLLFLRNAEMVGNIVALPIPYPYYHLMNFVLVLNFLLVAFVLSMFGTFGTVPMYSLIVSIFLGLREVANQLSDPFGNDAVDFPIRDFVTYVASQAICLLEVVGCMDETILADAIANSGEFDSDQVKMPVDRDALYVAPVNRNPTYDWGVAAPVRHLEVEASVNEYLVDCTRADRYRAESPEFEAMRQEQELQSLKKQKEALTQHIAAAWAHLEELEMLESHERVLGPERRRQEAARELETAAAEAAAAEAVATKAASADAGAANAAVAIDAAAVAPVGDQLAAAGIGEMPTLEAAMPAVPAATETLAAQNSQQQRPLPRSTADFSDFRDAQRRIRQALQDTRVVKPEARDEPLSLEQRDGSTLPTAEHADPFIDSFAETREWIREIRTVAAPNVAGGGRGLPSPEK